MELEMEAVEDVTLAGLAERLTAAAEALENAATRMNSLQASGARETSSRETELERQLAEAHAALGAIRGRKTIAAGAGNMIAKEGGPADFSGIDSALTSLSIEQRIAVKAGLMRSGILG